MFAIVENSPEVQTPSQLARRMIWGDHKVLKLIKAGELEAIDVSMPGSPKPRYLITREAFQLFLESRTTKKPSRPIRRKKAKVDPNVEEFFK